MRSTSGQGSVERPRDRDPNSKVVVPDASRPRRRQHFTVELRQLREPLADAELRRRQQELERLIIKAACRRAARLAGQSDAHAYKVYAPVSTVL
jgi:hypothetical protein